MGSKVQQERFEKALKQLLRQTENKHCVHCSVLGPTYVVAKYGIFICTQCSSVQRDFARCKSVSMSKFDAEEVEIMKKQGNAWAWKSYLADWTDSKTGRPLESSRDPEKLKKWIRDVFEDKKYFKEPAAASHSPQPTSSSLSSVSAPPPAQVSVAPNISTYSQPAPVQTKADAFDPFGSMEIPATNAFTTQPPPQTQVSTFDPFAASTPQPATVQQPQSSDSFDPFAVGPPQPAPADAIPAPTPVNPQPPAVQSRGALPEDIFSFAVEPPKEIASNGNNFSTAPIPNSNPNPTPPTTYTNPFPQQPNNMYYQPQVQQFQPQQQWQGQGQGQPQQQYMYGMQQQQLGGGFAFGGQYGQVPQQTQPQYGQNNFASQQQGFGTQGYPPQGQMQMQGQGGQGFGNPQMFQAPVGGNIQVKKQKDEFDFFGDLMTGVGKTNGVSGGAQLGQPKAEGNPFA